MTLTKILFGALAALLSTAALAAADVNKASQAELEAIKGIGPAASTRILDERKVAPFKDWSDLVDRVRGIGPGNAAKYSADGLTVNGSAYSGSSVAMADGTKAARAPAAAKPDANAAKDKPALPAAVKAPATKAP